MDFHHHNYLQAVADEDVRFVKEKDRSYNASWKQSGGRSAWFMLRRKMDRLISMLGAPTPPEDFDARRVAEEAPDADGETATLPSTYLSYLLRAHSSEDVFRAIEARPGGEDGSPLAEVRDLRRYLLLVESEMIARGVLHTAARRPVEGGTRVVHGPATMGIDGVTRVPERVDPPFSRRPHDPTQYEFDSFRNLTVPSGTMAGRLWSELYDYDRARMRPWMMMEQHRTEYAQ